MKANSPIPALILTAAGLLFSGCLTFYTPLLPRHPKWEELSKNQQSERHSLIRQAEAYMYTPSSYTDDCTGTVLGVYDLAGYNRKDLMAAPGATGVHRLYNRALAAGAYKTEGLPLPGDLVFWDNTWDQDKNGIADDPLTHVGLVIEVDNEGTVKYLHQNYRRGPVIESMNLTNPSQRFVDHGYWQEEINSPMKKKNHPGAKWLSGELYRGYADGLKMADS